MSESTYLLDTSAVLTFLEDEEGAERIETLLRREKIVLPYLVLVGDVLHHAPGITRGCSGQKVCAAETASGHHLVGYGRANFVNSRTFQSTSPALAG